GGRRARLYVGLSEVVFFSPRADSSPPEPASSRPEGVVRPNPSGLASPRCPQSGTQRGRSQLRQIWSDNTQMADGRPAAAGLRRIGRDRGQAAAGPGLGQPQRLRTRGTRADWLRLFSATLTPTEG